MRIPVIFLTLLSSFGAPGFVAATYEVHQQIPVVKAHSYAAGLRHDVPVVALDAAAVYSPQSIRALQDVIPPAVEVHSHRSIHAPVVAVPAVKAHSFATGVKHHVPVISPAAVPLHSPKYIHAVDNVPVVPRQFVSAIDPVISIESPVVKSLPRIAQLQHEVPAAVISPVAVGAAPKSIHAFNTVDVAPAIAPAPLVNLHAPKSVHVPLQPVEVPIVKSFSYAGEVQHNAPLAAVAPVAIGASPKSIHAAGAVATGAVAVNAPALAHAGVGASPKSIHAVGALHAVPAVAPAPVVNLHVPKSIHAPVEAPIVKSFSYASEIQHDAPVAAVAPVAIGASPKSIYNAGAVAAAPVIAPALSHAAVGAAPKSIHAVGALHAVPAVAPAPIVNLHVPKSIHVPHEPFPIMRKFSYAANVNHETPVAISTPIGAAPKSIHAATIPAIKHLHPAKSINTAGIPLHGPVSPALTGTVPISTAKTYSTGIRKEIPLVPSIKYLSGAVLPRTPVIATSPVSLHTPARLTNKYGYGHVVPISAQHGFNVPLNRDIYHSHPSMFARIAAPGAHLWNGHSIKNGVAYVAGTTGPFAYHPVPVYYENFHNPTNAVYHYLKAEQVINLDGPYYNFKFSNEDEGKHAREEARDADGIIRGKFSYVDPNGYKREVRYTADETGFKPEGDITVDKKTADEAAAMAAFAPKAPESLKFNFVPPFSYFSTKQPVYTPFFHPQPPFVLNYPFGLRIQK